MGFGTVGYFIAVCDVYDFRNGINPIFSAGFSTISVFSHFNN